MMQELLTERDRGVIAAMTASRGDLTSTGVTAKPWGQIASGWWRSSATTESLYQATSGLAVVLAMEGTLADLPRIIHVGGVPAPWLHEVEESLEHLRALQVNWNGYQAPPIPTGLIDSAKEGVRELATLPIPAPEVTATNAGQVQLEWHGAHVDLEIRVVGAQQYSVYYEDEAQPAENLEVQVTGAPALLAFEPLLRRL